MQALPRVVVGISGASGMPYALDLLEALQGLAEVHLVVSQGAKRVLWEEVGLSPKDLYPLASRVYKDADLGASIASGSFPTRGMVVVPCSAATLAKIALGLADTLLTRAAYVHLKEKRPLILVPRETPLPLPTLRAMVQAAEAGAVVLPASPGFYHRPREIKDLLGFVTQRILDHLGLKAERAPRWGGT
ncbi:3-octaprenyl-4-hydroxybenzoate carboxy-lyase [Thermus sp. 2.9]|jgi:4-hydroxy-3-polyprenylbenzoate decarboxylase|uniref:UbiX family flavin prenyltransferase n=1 Tax=unclassified Thermus TaxID=2619321 RepID=UPI0005425F6D|nr:UbiX family flavin prenyltransferase [Thermus sp. 2.9]KHG65504.1 3-octaprenyl-4-hydroxybenzoate carboxy-lyase [Thermus sp. 2.9]